MHALNWLRVNLRVQSPRAPVFEVWMDIGGNWRWRERASNGQISASAGEAYFSKYNAKRAAYAKAARVDGATVRVLG